MKKNNFSTFLFEGIEKDQIEKVLICLDSYEKYYEKGSYIFNAGDNPEYFGVVISGQVNIIKDSITGERTVISSILPNQIFGESFSIARITSYPISAQAAVNSNIILLKSNKLTSTCEKICVFHKKIIDNMLKIIARKNIELNNKINCMSKKTLKQKILYFLDTEAKILNDEEVLIPYNREEFADYMGVNRSALSRALSEMKKAGIITYNKNRFQLKNIDKYQDLLHK